MSISSDAASEAVAAVVGDLFPETRAEAPAPAGEQPAPETPNVVSEPAPEPERSPFDADTTGLDFLDDEPEPDPFDDIEDDTLEPVAVDDESDEYVDPNVAKILAQNKKLQAMVEHERSLRKQAKEKDWRAEAQRRFPLCLPTTLSGDSRRAVLRAAKMQHDQISSVVKPYLEEITQARSAILDEARTEGRAAAEQAWGKPTSGPNTAMIEAVELSEQDQNKHDRSKYRNLLESIKGRQEKGFGI